MTENKYLKKAALIQHGYILNEKHGIELFKARSLNAFNEIDHGFTSRNGGNSAPPFNSLNLGFGRECDKETVILNYKTLAGKAELDYNSFVLVNFEHGTNVVKVEKKDALKGIEKEPLEKCDAIVTNETGVTLLTNHADCGVFFLYDPNKKAIGIAHAGWKGMLGRIGAKTVEKMKKEYGCNPKDIIASSGPCICKKCYEVDEELALKFEAEFNCKECSTESDKKGKRMLDLEMAAFIQLVDAGLQAENITLMQLCTYENENWFYSYRRDGKNAGDMAAYIKLV